MTKLVLPIRCCEDHLRNDLYCVGWGVKLCLIQNRSCCTHPRTPVLSAPQ